MTTSDIAVDPEELITRSLNRIWVVDGVIGPTAFDWSDNETYLSVNREAVDSYKTDLVNFVSNHSSYAFDKGGIRGVLVAEMNVGNVNNIRFLRDEHQLSVELPVYVRSSRVKSHAGIFAKSDEKNLNRNLSLIIKPTELGISASAILQELRLKLVNISTLKHIAL